VGPTVAGTETETDGDGVAACVAVGESETGATEALAVGVTSADGEATLHPVTRATARSSRTVAL